ncbi:MAG: class I SAM-dependent methyltransferase [Verrucomicrobiota bacterium]
MSETNLDQHNIEIHENRLAWEKKKSLRMAYGRFYAAIAGHIQPGLPGLKLELGSGMGNIKQYIPDCITSDLFPNPWLDRVENAYALNFPDGSIGHLILFDVWHHLEYPANALKEARRVLVPGGKIILMEPAMSLVGRLVYGNCHHEPLGFESKFSDVPADISAPEATRYFAAQSSAHRMFLKRELPGVLRGWDVCSIRQITSFAYLGSGGFRGPQLYPDFVAPAVRLADSVLGLLPDMFAARILAVLKKL